MTEAPRHQASPSPGELPPNETTHRRLSIRMMLWLGALVAACIIYFLPVWEKQLQAAFYLLFFGLPAIFVFLAIDNLMVVYSRRKSRFDRQLGWGLLVLLLGGAIFVWDAEVSILRASKTSADKERCVINLRYLSEAARRYADANDGKLPPAARWSDAILPYIEDKKAFLCPTAPKARTGYAYNRAVARVRVEDIENAENVVLFFESDRGWNAAGGPELLPSHPRHYQGDDYIFVDGHVRWFRRTSGLTPDVGTTAPEDNSLTWQPKLKHLEP